jgi:oligopeptide transport system ATP-binding protein
LKNSQLSADRQTTIRSKPLCRGTPTHPYTLGLLRSTPRLEEQVGALSTIPGQPPNLQALPPGCAFNDRCPFAFERCTLRPPLAPFAPGRLKACHLERLP